jgi:hypothetical protein
MDERGAIRIGIRECAEPFKRSGSSLKLGLMQELAVTVIDHVNIRFSQSALRQRDRPAYPA